METASDQLRLRFTGVPLEPRAVPAATLARALDSFQRIVHLIGMRQEGRTLDRRARPSLDVQRRFVLVCDPPEPGSYLQPLRLTSLESDLLSRDEMDRAHADLGRFLSAIGQKSENGLEDAVPDSTYRRFMLDALAAAMPEPRSGINLEVLAGQRRLLSSATVQIFVENQRRPHLSAASAGVVNGELMEIDFSERRIKLRLLGVNREIYCGYEDAVEATLLDHPRELIQVYGSITVDGKGVARKIEAVEFIRPIREAEDIQIDAFLLGNRMVRPRRPFAARLRFDRDEQLFLASAPPLAIETAGETRDDAADGLIAELRMLWRNYARMEDERLTAGARDLKKQLLDMFEEISDAA